MAITALMRRGDKMKMLFWVREMLMRYVKAPKSSVSIKLWANSIFMDHCGIPIFLRMPTIIDANKIGVVMKPGR
jgi:hypothetical protein